MRKRPCGAFREEELKPYQAELIRLQQYLEASRTRMIILFEGGMLPEKEGPFAASHAI